MAKVEITGRNREVAEVTPDLAVLVSNQPYPAFAQQKIHPFSEFMMTSAGSEDMSVDGSSTNVDFFISAQDTEDRYVSSLSVIVAYGQTGNPYKWADANPLTNGHRLFYSSTRGEVDIFDGIKANQDFFRLQPDWVPAAWEVRGVNAVNDYGYFITINLANDVPPFGIKLDAGSTQRLTMRIRDDATDADSFNIRAYGFDRFS